MKMLRITLVVALFAGGSALAQTYTDRGNGKVTITGSVGSAASIKFDSAAPIGTGPAVANTPAAAGSALDTTITLGDITPTLANDGADLGATVTLQLRSNQPYKLHAVATGLSTVDGQVRFADFGYGLDTVNRAGTLVMAGTDAFGAVGTGDFNNNGLPLAAPDADGLPVYESTLNNVAAKTEVMSGPRISERGGYSNPNNALKVNSHYTIQPQYFDPTAAFTAVVTYTISTP